MSVFVSDCLHGVPIIRLTSGSLSIYDPRHYTLFVLVFVPLP